MVWRCGAAAAGLFGLVPVTVASLMTVLTPVPDLLVVCRRPGRWGITNTPGGRTANAPLRPLAAPPNLRDRTVSASSLCALDNPIELAGAQGRSAAACRVARCPLFERFSARW